MGSSPRVRGKPGTGDHPHPARRLIPARAGKTPTWPESRWSPTAHPRACGENRTGIAARDLSRGSSPRVRGKPRRSGVCWRSLGLIPARAGKTGCRSIMCGPGRAHPRACGENHLLEPEFGGAGGSSPRVRGKPCLDPQSLSPAGLIPARAGKTPTVAAPLSLGAAHPRACGENSSYHSRPRAPKGSSPRVRGKPVIARSDQRVQRLIPARAGKTPPPRCLSGPLRAHPRACGENGNRNPTTRTPPGSSPRVRGKPRAGEGEPPRLGLIPARAGKTARARPPASLMRAHPRACGENTS